MAVFINNCINCLLWVYTCWFLYYYSGSQPFQHQGGVVTDGWCCFCLENRMKVKVSNLFFPQFFIANRAAAIIKSALHPYRWWNKMEWCFGKTGKSPYFHSCPVVVLSEWKDLFHNFLFNIYIFLTLNMFTKTRFSFPNLLLRVSIFEAFVGGLIKNLIFLHVLYIMKKKK